MRAIISDKSKTGSGEVLRNVFGKRPKKVTALETRQKFVSYVNTTFTYETKYGFWVKIKWSEKDMSIEIQVGCSKYLTSLHFFRLRSQQSGYYFRLRENFLIGHYCLKHYFSLTICCVKSYPLRKFHYS